MTQTKAYQKRQAKATQRRRRTAHERLQRDQAQAQHAAEALEQALQELTLPTPSSKRSRDACAASRNCWGKSSASCFPRSLAVARPRN